MNSRNTKNSIFSESAEPNAQPKEGGEEMAAFAQQYQNQPETSPGSQKRPGGKGVVVALQTVTIGFPKKSLVFGILAAFAMCFLILYRYGLLSEMNLKLGQMNRTCINLRETGRVLKVEIESDLQLDEIRNAAVTRFGMHEPSTNQVVSVRVPKSQYSVVSDPGYIQSVSDPKRGIITRALDALDAVLP
jgi:hypothetical protein